jgi:hypothetical protein
MDKVYRKYMKDPAKFVAKYGNGSASNGSSTVTSGDVTGHNGINGLANSITNSRMSYGTAEREMTREETLYMLAVERGDVPKVRLVFV